MTESVPETEVESDFEATPSPSPVMKKGKIVGSAKKRRTALSAAALCHYYSSTDKKEQLSTPMKKRKGARISSAKTPLKPLHEQTDVPSDDADCDITITKEVKSSASRTMQRMVQAAKQRPGLRNTTA